MRHKKYKTPHTCLQLFKGLFAWFRERKSKQWSLEDPGLRKGSCLYCFYGFEPESSVIILPLKHLREKLFNDLGCKYLEWKRWVRMSSTCWQRAVEGKSFSRWTKRIRLKACRSHIVPVGGGGACVWPHPPFKPSLLDKHARAPRCVFWIHKPENAKEVIFSVWGPDFTALKQEFPLDGVTWLQGKRDWANGWGLHVKLTR